MSISPRRFNFSDVKGISRDQLQQHYQLYLGYIRSQENILSILEREKPGNNQYRGLKEGETYSLDGIILHELYFRNLGQSSMRPDGRLLELMERDFGSYSEWINDFLRTGELARGWAVLAYNYRDERLHNFMQDAHNIGAVWHSTPLLVLDVYEHAYMIDFGINKEMYLQVFRRNIDWEVVNERFKHISKQL
ncbi:MAG TPA: Fe-Mn family superoxide dismutase [Halanaerobiales bacterium]|nr:Fe-Mn family superoxide dismutase [Halanaerobiales bacterium]